MTENHRSGEHTLHRLGGCAVALALLLPTQATASPSAPEQRAHASVTKSRTVKLGHKPVRASSRERVRLTFEGKRGALVNLARWADSETCGRRVLKKPSGSELKPWAQGYWRLPRTGTYTALSKPCRGPRHRIRLQVRRVVQHDAAVPGRVTVIGKRAHVTHLVPVFVGADERVGLVPSAAIPEVVGPDRKVTRSSDPAPVLRETGRHWVALEPESSLESTLTVRRSAQVDGATIALPRMGTADTTQEVGFTASAGQWVYAELLGADGAWASDTVRDVRVVAPDGREVEKIVGLCHPGPLQGRCTRIGPWPLPATGAYTMRIVAQYPDREKAATLRVRAAALAPDLRMDAGAVTYRTTSPGQWVVGRWSAPQPAGSPNAPGARVTASNASPALGSWAFMLAPRFPYSLNCGPGDGNGCDDYFSSGVGPTSPTATTVGFTNPAEDISWAVLTVPPGAQGSVDISLASPTTQR